MTLLIKQKKFLFILILALVISVVLYGQLFSTFYQQDEWQGVGNMFAYGTQYLTNSLFSLGSIFGNNRPLTNVLNYFLFTTLPFNIMLVAGLYVVLHAFNSFLIFILIFTLFRKYIPSFFAMIFFEINSVSSQAVNWLGNSTPVATFFILISLILYIKHLKSNSNKYIILSYALLIISFFFKEIGIAFLLVYLIIDVYRYKKNNFLNNKYAYFLSGYLVSFLVYRLFNLLHRTEKIADFVNTSMPIKSILTFHGILYSYTAFSQLFIPTSFAFTIAEKFMRINYPWLINSPQFNALFQTVGSDLLMIMISSLILILVTYFISTDKKNSFYLIFSLILVVAGVMPYIIINRGSSYLESRYYYLSLVGISIVIGYFFLRITEYKNLALLSISIIFFSIYILFHANGILSTNYDLTQISRERMNILTEMKSNIPQVDRKAVFYITSNHTYIIDNNPLPFQQGIGYTVLLWYFNKKNEGWKELLLDDYLWNLGSQGYKQIGSEGFGFFYDFNEMQKEYMKKSISINEIYAFYWDGNKDKLLDKTNEVRKELKERGSNLSFQ